MEIKTFIFEDDQEDLFYLEQLLLDSKIKLNISSSNSLSDGLEQLATNDYDLIISDLNITDSTGIDTFREIIKMCSTIPIIVLTGLNSTTTGEKAVSEGAQDFLVKSKIDTFSLEKSITYAISRMEISKALKESEQQYKKQAKLLEDAILTKDLLMDIVTHDAKNEVGAIYGLSELLHDDYPKNEIISSIYKSSSSVIKLLDNAHLLTKISNKEEIPKGEISVTAIIAKVVKDIAVYALNKGVSIINEVTEDICLSCNPIIEEVFKNYIDNAIKYGSKGKSVVINLEEQEEDFIFKVIDFGDTIELGYREKIFNKSYQIDKSNKGSGIGLSIVKRIADAHCGKVWVEPNYPVGNRFCLRLKKLEYA